MDRLANGIARSLSSFSGASPLYIRYMIPSQLRRSVLLAFYRNVSWALTLKVWRNSTWTCFVAAKVPVLLQCCSPWRDDGEIKSMVQLCSGAGMLEKLTSGSFLCMVAYLRRSSFSIWRTSLTTNEILSFYCRLIFFLTCFSRLLCYERIIRCRCG